MSAGMFRVFVRPPTDERENVFRELWKFFSISFLVEMFFPFYAHLPLFLFYFFTPVFMVGEERKREMHHVHIIGPIATLL